MVCVEIFHFVPIFSISPRSCLASHFFLPYLTRPNNEAERNINMTHTIVLNSLMQRVAGSTVTNDRHHGARGGTYGAYEHYV